MKPSGTRSVSWIIFAVSALTAIGFFFVPAFVIRPFRYQSVSALNLAMAVREHAPIVSLVAGLVCLVFFLLLWRGARIWRKVALSSVMLLVAFSAVMSRLNYFEWMFHPVDSPQFQAESDSKLDKSEMVLAIQFGNASRAYPISQMAYHHILNDVVEGVPVAVTY